VKTDEAGASELPEQTGELPEQANRLPEQANDH
jgi:hypothetical protein